MPACECGCGAVVKRRFVRGHSVRVTGSPALRGARHYRWSGSNKSISSHGYVKVRVGREHPCADPNGYAYEHLLVWLSAGNARPGRGEILHHVSGDKTDNRIENLRLMNRGRHIMDEHAARGADGRLVGKHTAGRLLDGRTWDEVPDAR